MANTRELSQLASIINIIDQSKSIGIITEYPNAKVGIGTLVPTSKVDVVGDVNVSGTITATSFYGDGSNLQGISAGFGPEDSINTTGIITASSFYGDGSNLSGIATFSGDYNDLTNKPQIPSDTGDLTNNAGFVNSSIVVGLASEGYVTQQISNLVAGAPEALDTLNELAAALNDDQNFATSITNSLVGLASEGYVNNLVAISTFSGDYNDLSNKPEIPSIVGLASEGYVDSQVGIATAGLASVSYVNTLVSISTFSRNYEDLTGKPNIPQSGVDFDPAGTDNSTNVTLSGSYDYLTLSNQQITLNQIDASTDVSGLSTIATSGNYNDLLNIPQIPSDTSDLTNNAGFVTSEIIAGLASEGYVNNLVAISTFSGDYNDLSNQPSIPSVIGLASEGYVDVAVANLVDSAPSTLDTLNELAAALGDDANFSTTITNNLANKADLSGANFIGVVTATSFSGDGSNLTGVSAGSTVADDTSTNETFYPIFTQTTSGTVTATKVSTTNLTFNPSTGSLSAVDFDSTSDINLKENIQIIENPIEKVLQLNGITFNWKSSHQSSAGVIAQEVEKVLPEIVRENDEHKSVSYNGLIGLLIEVVKEQQKQIDELKNRV